MIPTQLQPSAAYLQSLIPLTYTMTNGRTLRYFHSPNVDLLKLDLIYRNGAAFQPKPLCAGLALDMMLLASDIHSSSYVAEFFDRRGVIVDRQLSTYSSRLSITLPAAYAAETLPLIAHILYHPHLQQPDFEVLIAKRRQTLSANSHNTSSMARNLFFSSLFGTDHPEGRYAKPGDEQNITLNEVARFASSCYLLPYADLVASGNLSPQVLRLIDACFGSISPLRSHPDQVVAPHVHAPQSSRHTLDGAVQSSLRLGRLLPLPPDSVQAAEIHMLNTIIGGYFGSRLMSLIRETKGYTYSIYSLFYFLSSPIPSTSDTQPTPTSVFLIATDVAAQAEQDAIDDIRLLLTDLSLEPPSEDELVRVANHMAGDFLRSTDGVLEHAERYWLMLESGVTEASTANLLNLLSSANTATLGQRLQQLAATYLQPDSLSQTVVGPPLAE